MFNLSNTYFFIYYYFFPVLIFILLFINIYLLFKKEKTIEIANNMFSEMFKSNIKKMEDMEHNIKYISTKLEQEHKRAVTIIQYEYENTNKKLIKTTKEEMNKFIEENIKSLENSILKSEKIKNETIEETNKIRIENNKLYKMVNSRNKKISKLEGAINKIDDI